MKRIAIAIALLLLATGAAFAQHATLVSNQANFSFAITPSDSATFTPTAAIFNGNATACIINMKLAGDSAAVTWNNVQPGQILPVRAIMVTSATTTCTNLVALYPQ